MLSINYKQIYETKEKGTKEWVLIIYDISANHYVGLPVYADKREECIYCKSINKYVDVKRISDYNKSKMRRCIYEHKKPIKLSSKEYEMILKNVRCQYLSLWTII